MTTWHDVGAVGSVEEGEVVGLAAGGQPIALFLNDGAYHALHDRCSHRGCLLSSGEVEGESITCPCHGSRFDLRDGSIERGPATAPQPVFEARVGEGGIEIRLPAPA